MKKFNLSLLASALFSFGYANASDTIDAQQLVGKFYGGLHLNFIKPDEDRINGINDDFELGNGVGFEAGYRYSTSTEFRLSYTDLDIEFEKSSADQEGDALSFDLLYFPTEQNYYLLGGVNNLDIGETELSANLGLGYRHYFSEKFAAYAEAKAHFQFDESYIDQSAQFGLIYFFGESKKSPAPAKQAKAPEAPKKAVAPVAKVAAPKDSDNDGIIDKNDQCPNTPAADKVDQNGCTVFTEKTLSQKLLINFDNNQSIIKANYVNEVARIAKFLQQYPHTDMTIEGHTSSQGSAKYNQTLSQKRADAVVNLLVEKFAIDASRLNAKGFGESMLINPANSAKAHAENRRIEAKVSITKKVAVTK